MFRFVFVVLLLAEARSFAVCERPLTDKPKRIAIVTDISSETVTGMMRTIDGLVARLRDQGHSVLLVNAEQLGLKTFPVPVYPAVRLPLGALLPSVRPKLLQLIQNFNPDHLHISSEGPLGIAARQLARQQSWKFTTAFHTHYPHYINIHSYGLIPYCLVYQAICYFHRAADRTLVTNPAMERELNERGVERTAIWGRGVDFDHYQPNENARSDLQQRQGLVWPHLGETDEERDYFRRLILNGPVFTYLGRVSKEKRIEDFLRTELPGLKLVIGPGPSGKGPTTDRYLRRLIQSYQGRGPVLFVGEQTGQTKIDLLSLASVLVFPSRTDTFGNVQIEAMAMGVPVAAYPDTPSSGILIDGVSGVLRSDIREAALSALKLDREKVMQASQAFTHEAATQQFLDGLVPIHAR